MRSTNRNDVAREIREGISQGRYKDCLNLCIAGPGDDGIAVFQTHCKASALEDSTSNGIVISYGELNCPKDCNFFKSRVEVEEKELRAQVEKQTKERRQRRRQALYNAVQHMAIPFKWFGQLAWQVQLAIIFLLVLAFSPKWVPSIVELIRALK